MNSNAQIAAPPLRPKLLRRYFWFLAGFVTVLLLVASAPEAYLAYRDNRMRIAELQSAEAKLAANRVVNFLEYNERLLSEVDALPWSGGALTESDRIAEYERLMKLAPAIREIEHIDAGEKTSLRISRTDPNQLAAVPSAGGLAAAKEVKRVGKWYAPTYLRVGNVPHVTMAMAVAEGRGGTTIVQINLKFVADVVAQIHFGKAGQAYVIDSANKLVAHPNLSLVLRRADISGSLPASLLARPAEGSEKNVASTPATNGVTVAAQSTGTAFFESDGLEGGRMLSSAVRMSPAAW